MGSIRQESVKGKQNIHSGTRINDQEKIAHFLFISQRPRNVSSSAAQHSISCVAFFSKFTCGCVFLSLRIWYFYAPKSIERKYNRMHIPVFPGSRSITFCLARYEEWCRNGRVLGVLQAAHCIVLSLSLAHSGTSTWKYLCTEFLCSWLEYSIACNLLYPGKHLSWNTSRTCDMHLLAGELGRKLNTRKLSIVKLRSSRLPRILVLVFKHL